MTERNNALRSGERQVNSDLDKIEKWHIWRYKEALQYIKTTDKVLDLCCGCGYGTHILSEIASLVVGVDISKDAIDYANEHWKNDKTVFKCACSTTVNENFDVVICYEGIEHIQDTDLLFSVFKSIAPKKFIISIPHTKCPIGGNKFHYRHYGMDELVERFWGMNYQPERAELRWFNTSLCNFAIFKRR